MDKQAILNHTLQPARVNNEPFINATALWTQFMQAGTPNKLCDLLDKGVRGITPLDFYKEAGEGGAVFMTAEAALLLISEKGGKMSSNNTSLINAYLSSLIEKANNTVQ